MSWCPFCGAQGSEPCRRAEATYSPPLPPLRQHHPARDRTEGGQGNDHSHPDHGGP